MHAILCYVIIMMCLIAIVKKKSIIIIMAMIFAFQSSVYFL